MLHVFCAMAKSSRRQLLIASAGALTAFSGCSVVSDRSDDSQIDLMAIGADNQTDRDLTIHSLTIDEESDDVVYWDSNVVESGANWWHEFDQRSGDGKYTVRMRVNNIAETARPHKWESECTWAQALLEQPGEELQLSIPEAKIDCDGI